MTAISHSPEHVPTGSMARLLKTLERHAETGILTVAQGDLVVNVSTLSGRPMFALSSDEEDRLGGTLLRLGRIDLPGLGDAVRRMLDEECRLGEILVDEGLLDQETLEEALRTQVCDILCRMLRLQGAQCSFREQTLAYDIDFNFSVNSLIREAFFRVDAPYRILNETGGLAAAYAKSISFSDEIATVELPPQHSAILPLFDRPVSLRDLCLETDISDLDVCRLVWVLLSIGAITRLE